MYKTVVVTASDRCFTGQMQDSSGPLVEESLPPKDFTILERKIVPDDIEVIKGALMHFVNRGDVDLILTTGGTGFGPRDVTPEATSMVIQRRTPGIEFAIYSRGVQSTPYAVLSRGVSGIRHKTLIINLPGNPDSIEESIDALVPVLPHALNLIKSDSAEDEHKFIK
ncbi:MogA/MoaB family molybdenum cofactor biosynthesis protein [candidate division KSB1 bacterium]